MIVRNSRVLVVEDDADGQVLLTTLLGHLGIAVDAANDSTEAEQLLFHSGSTYDAAIIDLALPDKDGWQLLSEMQASPLTADVPCIAITAYHNSKLREDATLAGFRAYFPKPLDEGLLLGALDTML